MSGLIIFDCDGVLVDSEIIAHQVEIECFKEIGYQITLEESIKNFTGVSDSYVSQIIFQETGNSISQNFFYETQQKIVQAFETQLKPLMDSVLPYLYDNNISRCVASSSIPERVKRSLEITHQWSFFEEDTIFTSSLVKKGKPAPDLFLYAADKIGFKPAECMVIEDSIAGIQAAIAAEMNVVAFLGGSHTKYPWYLEEINKFKIPIIHNPTDLIRFIQNFVEEIL